MNFTLTVLGTASAMPMVDRYQSAQVLSVHGRFFLIDCGEGCQRQLMRCHIPLQRIDSLFISHIHGDHIFGLYPLLSTLGMLKRDTPLNIYAPSSFAPILKFFLSYYGQGIDFEIIHHPLTMKEPETVFETRTLEVEAFPLNHKIETFGFLFREKEPRMNVRKEKIGEYGLSVEEIGRIKNGGDVVRGDILIPNSELAYKPYEPRSYAYCSDTAPFPELSGWVKGVDLLYHEATYTEEFAEKAAERYHSTARQAAECAKTAGAGRLVVAHYSSRCRDIGAILDECRSVFPESVAASDGDVFDIPLEQKR
ncbi:MAG: ribonuclease Z [Bacteroidales bacterium]|nr:ribonuclease Z [Bacteroidales bacterium]